MSSVLPGLLISCSRLSLSVPFLWDPFRPSQTFCLQFFPCSSGLSKTSDQAYIEFESIEAIVKTASRTKFFIEFYSTCLEGQRGPRVGCGSREGGRLEAPGIVSPQSGEKGSWEVFSIGCPSPSSQNIRRALRMMPRAVTTSTSSKCSGPPASCPR